MMGNAEQKAHDLACAVISNPVIFDGMVKENHKKGETTQIVNIVAFYEELYLRYLDHFLQNK